MSNGIPTRFQFLKGTTAQRIAFVLKPGEAVYDTEMKKLFIGDGETYGGNLPTPDPAGSFNIVVHTTDTTLTVEDYVIVNSAVPVEITVQDAATHLKPVHIKSIGAGVTTVVGVGGQTFDGETDIQLAQTNSITLVPKSGEWYVW